MKKHLLVSGILILTLLTSMSLASAEVITPDTQPERAAFYIDGQPTQLGTDPFVVGSTTYVSVRAFSEAMGADSVTWDSGTATVTAPGLTLKATAGSIYLEANGRYLFVPKGCFVISNSLMAPVRVLAKAFDATVSWDAATQAVFITKGTGAIKPGSEFYDETDLKWLSRIINAEARGESMTGKIAVGGVIMNRVASSKFPNTIHDVIFDRRNGVQFTPAYSGAIYNTPSAESIIAAKIVLDGGNTAGNALYFASTKNCWAAKTRPYAMTIGNHTFYA
ncbi:cell wall hydrolase [Oscillospiraceae bacterium WX1]